MKDEPSKGARGHVLVEVAPESSETDIQRWGRFKSWLFRVFRSPLGRRATHNLVHSGDALLLAPAREGARLIAEIEEARARAHKTDVDSHLAARRFDAEDDLARAQAGTEYAQQIKVLREAGFDAEPVMRGSKVVGLRVQDGERKPSRSKGRASPSSPRERQARSKKTLS